MHRKKTKFFHISILQFSTLLILIFILELAAGIAGYALRNQTTSYLTGTLTESMQDYKLSSDTTYMWDLIQKEVSCFFVLTCFFIHIVCDSKQLFLSFQQQFFKNEKYCKKPIFTAIHNVSIVLQTNKLIVLI